MFASPCNNQLGSIDPWDNLSSIYPKLKPTKAVNENTINAFIKPNCDINITPCKDPKITAWIILPMVKPKNLLKHFPRKPLKNNSSAKPVLRKEKIIAGISAVKPLSSSCCAVNWAVSEVILSINNELTEKNTKKRIIHMINVFLDFIIGLYRPKQVKKELCFLLVKK